ncbi:MAG: hypothetical protein CBB97_17275 [Candidatus Endolissoclinum sp. TMED37]|nr:MAG: hypothetical protein CBB97_17275 [Candidatus Endolissoclinum sp. TMED37]
MRRRAKAQKTAGTHENTAHCVAEPPWHAGVGSHLARPLQSRATEEAVETARAATGRASDTGKLPSPALPDLTEKMAAHRPRPPPRRRI